MVAIRSNPSLVHRTIRGLSQSTLLFERGRRWWLATLVLSAALLCGAFIVLRSVEQRLKEVIRDQLIATREANVYSLELWLEHQEARAQRIVDKDSVANAVSALTKHLEKSDELYDRLSTDEAFKQLQSTLTDRIGSEPNLGWFVLEPSGTILCASDSLLIGRNDYPLPNTARNRAIAGEAIVTTAFRSPVPLHNGRPERTPVIAALSPIKMNRQNVQGVFGLLLDPAEAFSHVLEVSRSGDTGESYVVDRQGLLISRSRFENQLRKLGLLPDDETVSSVLNVGLHDPGRDLRRSAKQEGDLSDLPLTVLASDLLRGGVDEQLEPYRDYRGVPVVGAWRWLSKYDFGLATEVDYEEAFRPISVLRLAFWILAAISFIAIIGLAALSFVVGRFQRRVEEADLTIKQLGQYTLLHLLGTGGMGAVYLGRHALLRRPVAIKVLRPEFNEDDRARVRFEREVQLTSQLTSPHTVSVFDYGTTSQGEFFYVMEYLEGVDLSQLIERFGPQPPGRVIHIMLQICESLSEAHAVNLIHRDVKPANILLCTRGTSYDFVKLVDFGLVKQEDAESMFITRTGAFAGTPMYMSPEAVRDGSEVTRLSDIYSLSAVAYWLLTGRCLFDPGTPMEICMLQVRQEPQLPSDFMANVPRDLESVIMQGLSKDPKTRPQSALEYAELLRKCSDVDAWSHEHAYRWWSEVYLPSPESETIHTVLAKDTFSGHSSRTNVNMNPSKVDEPEDCYKTIL